MVYSAFETDIDIPSMNKQRICSARNEKNCEDLGHIWCESLSKSDFTNISDEYQKALTLSQALAPCVMVEESIKTRYVYKRTNVLIPWSVFLQSLTR